MISSSSSSTTRDNDGLHQEGPLGTTISSNNSPVAVYTTNSNNTPQIVLLEEEEEELVVVERKQKKRREREDAGGDQQLQLSNLLAVVVKSLVSCKTFEENLYSSSSCCCSSDCSGMEISWPSNVRHVAHVTFDRFNGFLGLPVEFEPEVPRRPPSASTRVFGVSTECMQLSFDSRGNSVPTILLMMQRRLYTQGGLQAEGIFRINAENGQEEFVREQLNSGVVADNIDVHCLAGLIKAWFRELPQGVLDSLSPEEVMRAQSEEECVRLVRLLPPTESALLDWAINLMADVAEMEELNKMNARNIAMVFAPNMTQMADPLTALMYAVQVMNFLKILIERTLRDREESIIEAGPAPESKPFDENGHHGIACPTIHKENENDHDEEQNLLAQKTSSNDDDAGETLNHSDETVDNVITTSARVQSKSRRAKNAPLSSANRKKASSRRVCERQAVKNAEKNKDVSILDSLNSQTERIEAWR